MLLPLIFAGFSLVATQPVFASSIPADVLQKRQVSNITSQINAIIATGVNTTSALTLFSLLNQIPPGPVPSTIPRKLFTMQNLLNIVSYKVL
jgi:hypothetical protein